MNKDNSSNDQHQSQPVSKPENPNQDSGTSPPAIVNPTFEELCALEPRILTLYRTILSLQYVDLPPAFRRSATIGADCLWFGYGKQPFRFIGDISRIVGWALRHEPRTHPLLATSKAYDIVCDTLWDALYRRVAQLLTVYRRGYLPPGLICRPQIKRPAKRIQP